VCGLLVISFRRFARRRYQSHEVQQPDPPPPAGGSPLTRELLARVGLEPSAASTVGINPTGYGAGHEEHFDVTIYRNVAVVGGPAVEHIPIGRLVNEKESRRNAGYLGHNEHGRERILVDWLTRGVASTAAATSTAASNSVPDVAAHGTDDSDSCSQHGRSGGSRGDSGKGGGRSCGSGAGLSPLEGQRPTMCLLSRMYEMLALNRASRRDSYQSNEPLVAMPAAAHTGHHFSDDGQSES
jgi:hypothetical protein